MSNDPDREVPGGAQAFRLWLDGPPKRRQEDVAKTLGVAQQTVSRWALGTVPPGLLYRVRLKTIAGIAPESWLAADKRASGTLSVEEERTILEVANLEAKGAA